MSAPQTSGGMVWFETSKAVSELPCKPGLDWISLETPCLSHFFWVTTQHTMTAMSRTTGPQALVTWSEVSGNSVHL